MDVLTFAIIDQETSVEKCLSIMSNDDLFDMQDIKSFEVVLYSAENLFLPSLSAICSRYLQLFLL